MRFSKAILAIFALFAVILSATAVLATDNTSEVIDEVDYTCSTDGAEPIDVFDSIKLAEPLDVGEDETDADEGKTPDETADSKEADDSNADGKYNNSKVYLESKATGNPLIVLLAAMAIIGTGFKK